MGGIMGRLLVNEAPITTVHAGRDAARSSNGGLIRPGHVASRAGHVVSRAGHVASADRPDGSDVRTSRGRDASCDTRAGDGEGKVEGSGLVKRLVKPAGEGRA